MFIIRFIKVSAVNLQLWITKYVPTQLSPETKYKWFAAHGGMAVRRQPVHFFGSFLWASKEMNTPTAFVSLGGQRNHTPQTYPL